MSSKIKTGRLYIVSTPIGNLADMTYRAVDILGKVAFIMAEDTRTSKVLLDRYEIKTQMVSYRDQNHKYMIGKVIEKLDMGIDLALISDAGTPLISDPGYRLVQELTEKGYSVESIPGASGVISALSISGLPTDRFIFLGFLPKSDKKRNEIILEVSNLDATIVLYESPNRILALLNGLIEHTLGSRRISVHNDLTKMYEKTWRGTVNEVISQLRDVNLKGEFIVCIGKVGL